MPELTTPPSFLLIAQELHDSDFGKREEIHKIKRAKRAADVAATAAAP